MYLAVGAVAGLLAGLFGVGGGMVIVPILVFIFSANGFASEILVHLAVGTSFATIVITSMSSVAAHHQQGNVNWSVFRNLLPGLIFGVLLGSGVAAQLSGRELQFLIALFLVLISVQMLFEIQPKAMFAIPSKRIQLIIGGLIGWLSAFFGIGGGSLTVPFLSVCGQAMRNAVATSAACGLPIALFGALAYGYLGYGQDHMPAWSTGYIYWPAFIGIALASMPLAKVGAKIAGQMPDKILKRCFAVMIAAIAVHMLSQ